MAKFNGSNVGINRTVNKDGYPAYKMKDKDRLVTQVLTTFFGEPKFYGDNSNEIVASAQEIICCSGHADFVAKLAVYARKVFNMRSVSHVLTAVLANCKEGKAVVRKLIPAVVVRADDVTEILSAYLSMFGKPIPNSLKRGIGDAFKCFTEYSLAKYKGDGKSLSMKDVLRICHPKPTTKSQSDLWKRCIDGVLETPNTWETQLSAHGNNAETWTKLLDDNSLGYMALLRNLRNLLQANLDSVHYNAVFARIADRDAVKHSRQLPFRFLSAWRELQEIGSSKVFDALETALDYSVENMEKLPGKTCIVVDVSGSMSSSISARSTIRCSDISRLLGVMAAHICDDSIFLAFDDYIYIPAISSKGSILSQAMSIRYPGNGTNMHLPIQHLIEHKMNVDRIIILSDNEVNRGMNTVQQDVNEYRNTVNKDVWVHAIDLQGYGTQQFLGSRTNIIAGWSEKVLDFIRYAEQGMDTLVKCIESYDYTTMKTAIREEDVG